MKRHQELLTAAIERDGEGQQALMAGNRDAARTALRAAADLYRDSWEEAPPRSYGRLVGMLKAAILTGEGARRAAEYVRQSLSDDADAGGSQTASYALALAALIEGDDAEARSLSATMRGGSDAFDRTAAAITALADHDRDRYVAALEEIVHDFEQRAEHLTGVAIADTALALERLADLRGLGSGIRSEVLPTT